MIRARLKEPSTYAGIAAIVAGAGQIIGSETVVNAGAVIAQSAPQAVHGDWMGAFMIILGFAATFMKEKTNAKN